MTANPVVQTEKPIDRGRRIDGRRVLTSKWLTLALLIAVGGMTWRIGAELSSDAVGMAVGLVCGVLAGVPLAVLLLWAARRADVDAPATVGDVVAAPTFPGQAEIESALEPYRREDERLEAAAQRRGWGCDNG